MNPVCGSSMPGVHILGAQLECTSPGITASNATTLGSLEVEMKDGDERTAVPTEEAEMERMFFKGTY